MPLTASLAAGRRAKAARMTSRCTIERPGPDVTDPVSGVVTASMTEIYAGPCYLPKDAVDASRAQVAGVATVTAQRTAVELPWNAAAPAEGDVITIESSPTPGNIGRVLRVASVALDEDATALRVACEEVR